MTTSKLTAAKQISKRLEPIRFLPNVKRMQEENYLQTSSNAPSKMDRTMKFQNSQESTKEETTKALKQPMTGHEALEFVMQNHKLTICQDLLQSGYMDSFDDIFSLIALNE